MNPICPVPYDYLFDRCPAIVDSYKHYKLHNISIFGDDSLVEFKEYEEDYWKPVVDEYWNELGWLDQHKLILEYVQYLRSKLETTGKLYNHWMESYNEQRAKDKAEAGESG